MRDAPALELSNNDGDIGDTAEVRYNFKDFVRLNLGKNQNDSNWYRISDFVDWRVHIKLKKAANEDNPDDLIGLREIWIDDGSSTGLNHSGFLQ
jgi:hypothetical protein